MIRAVTHSAGIVFTTREAVDNEASFHVDAGGVTELGGWGHVGPVPPIYVNPPADMLALHTVTVEEDGDEDGEPDQAVLDHLATLVAEHLVRYAECRVWCVGLTRGLTNWATSGCPVAGDEEDADGVDGEDDSAPVGGSSEPNLDELRAEYKQVTGTDADGRWKEGRLAGEVKQAKVQAAKERATAARDRGRAETPEGQEPSGEGT